MSVSFDWIRIGEYVATYYQGHRYPADARFDMQYGNEDNIIVRCWRGKRYAVTHINSSQLRTAMGNADGAKWMFRNAFDYLCRLAGPPLRVPFRIGRKRSPKHLQIVPEAI